MTPDAVLMLTATGGMIGVIGGQLLIGFIGGVFKGMERRRIDANMKDLAKEMGKDGLHKCPQCGAYFISVDNDKI
jgi:hypothetical protein